MTQPTIKVPSKLIEGSELGKYVKINDNSLLVAVQLTKEFVKALIQLSDTTWDMDSYNINSLEFEVWDNSTKKDRSDELLITIRYDPS